MTDRPTSQLSMKFLAKGFYVNRLTGAFTFFLLVLPLNGRHFHQESSVGAENYDQ